MQIKIEGAQDAAQAEAIEKTLADALSQYNVEYATTPPNEGDSSKAVAEFLGAAFLLKLAESAAADLTAKALLTAITQVFSNPGNRGVFFDIQGYRFDYDQFRTNKLGRLADFIKTHGDATNAGPTRHALLIGVSHSSVDPTIPRLRFTEQDARLVGETMRTIESGAFGIATMINPFANEMRAAIHAFFDKKAPNDELFLFYSGHGIESSDGTYLCCHDTEVSRLALNGFSLDEIARFTNDCKAKQILIVLDCCYSGGARKILFNNAARRLLDAAHSDCSIHLITSSAPKQPSKENAEWEMGLFSHYFVDGVKTAAAAGSDGDITAATLHQFIRRNIESEQLPGYSVKDKKEEFFISRKPTPLLAIFDEVKEILSSFVNRKMISFQFAGKVMENCFGSSEVPKVRRDEFINGVRDFKAGRITYDDFRRLNERPVPIPNPKPGSGFSRKQLIYGAIGAFILLWLLSAIVG
jgi:hypothetical protein